MNPQLFQKDFISTQDWSVDDLNTMLDVALRLKGDFAAGIPHDQVLRAKTLYMLFFEESTRTRNSFETGVTQLGGHGIYLTPKATQIGHGENAKDTGMVLSSYGNAIAVRDCRTGIGQKYLYEMAEYAQVPIYSMQDDVDHPCQAMADLMTLVELFGLARDLNAAAEGLELGPSEVDTYMADGGQPIWLEVDGGVKVNNIASIVSAGADTLVAGSAVFGAPDADGGYRSVMQALRQAAAAPSPAPQA